MPPKRKKPATAPPPPPPPPLPLPGCVIAVSGTFPAGHPHGVLQKKVEDLGGKFEKTVTHNVTHLIVSQVDYKKNSTKVATAKANTIHIVSLDWLLDTESTSARQAEAGYSFMSIPSTSSTTTTSSKKKRSTTARSDDDDGPDNDDDRPSSKKPRSSNGHAKNTSSFRNDDDEDEADAKPKDTKAVVQTAKSLTTSVPVDEMFTGSGYCVYIEGEAVIFDAALNQTNASNNNNKFYKVQVSVRHSLDGTLL